jgi:hypothetical protein
MAVKNNHRLMVKKLKGQVRELEKKERLARKQLGSALKKLRSVVRSYESRLAAKMRIMKRRINEAQASSYAKAAVHFERQILKGMESKGKALMSALNRIEKKHAAKVRKSFARKSKADRHMKKSAPVKMAGRRKK